MLDLSNQKDKINELKGELETVEGALDTKKLQARLAELTAEQHSEGFWNDLGRAQVVNKEIKIVESKFTHFKKLENALADIEVLVELSEDEGGENELAEINSELDSLADKIDSLKLQSLLKGKYDALNAILTLHAGAGGTEAQDWVSMLYRMYTRYLELKGYSCKVLDRLDGEEAGIKSITFLAEGDYAYGYLKAERGIHRLVRISPFDSNKRRHTSFASLEVMPEITDSEEIKINPEDIKVDTYRSSGAGGQHVNKTESAIRITHLATGIVVQCQNERSQVQNREVAMHMLMSKLIERREREQAEEEASIKGDMKKIEWGSQIRSYVFCPYTLVKDHRTGYETGNIQAVMDGDIDGFITEYLKKS